MQNPLHRIVAYRCNPADSLMAYRCCFLVSVDGLSVQKPFFRSITALLIRRFHALYTATIRHFFADSGLSVHPMMDYRCNRL